MKTEFTKEYMTSNRGCYSRDEMLSVKCVKENNITLENLFNDLPIKDFCWFLIRKCDLTLEQKQRFALHCAKQVLPIFEKEYPNDLRVRECVEATGLFLDGKITREELIEKRDAASAASAYSVYAAYAAADAAVYYATADYYTAADAAVYAADAAVFADKEAFKKSVWNYVLTL